MLTNIVLPSASINSMLENIFKSLDMWGNNGAKIFGLICLVVGMYALGQALLDLRKHQPSTALASCRSWFDHRRLLLGWS